jgi:hypothetical protein
MFVEIKERLGGNMERTITESGALYFVQHKETVHNPPRRRGAAPRIWKFRIGSAAANSVATDGFPSRMTRVERERSPKFGFAS